MSAVLRRETVVVDVPATCANLGPGFDSFGLSLAFGDRIKVAVADDLTIDVEGEGADEVVRDESHLVVRAIRCGLAALGAPDTGLHLSCRNRIPHARGLGSSSSAIVSGLIAARALVPDATMSDAELLGLAIELEGHADNVTPCLYGGFTIALDDGGRTVVARPPFDHRIVPTIYVPGFQSGTEASRGLLPETIKLTDAAANSARTALLCYALGHRPDLLLTATEDRLHQQYRAELMRPSMDLLTKLRADSWPAVISGSGPTVLVLSTDASTPPPPQGWMRLQPGIDRQGARASIEL